MKIFVNVDRKLRQGFIRPETAARLAGMGQVTYCEDGALSGDRLQEALSGGALAGSEGYDLLLSGWGQRRIYPHQLGNVRMIAHLGGSVNGIVDMSVYDRGVMVVSGNYYYAESVAEGVIAYMLFALRDMGYHSEALKRGVWHENTTEGLFDQPVGIVSLGATSRLVVEHLRHFRCRVKVYSTRPDPALAAQMGFVYADLAEIFATCKIVSLHTARTPQTYHMIGAEHFALLQPGAIFLNTARAEVVDEAAMVAALRKGGFRAVLDVFGKEPLPADSPLCTLPNVTLFPHQCGPTADRWDRITNFLLDDAEAYFAGRPVKNEIPRSVAERMTLQGGGDK
ncbi:MAG: hydroxyacid dehydrogenase [Eubacteriales bacterium]